MKEVLWGNEKYPLADSQEKAFDILVYACQLAIDQANNSAEEYLNKLRNDYMVSGLPESVSEIQFKVFGGAHRDYTHHGWDYAYPIEPNSMYDKAKWPLRKDILLRATAKVFGFRTQGQFLWIKWGYDKKCNSMAALMYYIHILADHQDYLDEKHADYLAESPELMPFVSERDDEPDVISEIMKHLEIIFEDQTSSDNYMFLNNALKAIKGEAQDKKGNDTIDVAEKRKLYKVQVDECIKCLSERVHVLLKNEDFWTKMFP